MYGGTSEINERVGENRDTEGISSEQLMHMHDRIIAGKTGQSPSTASVARIQLNSLPNSKNKTKASKPCLI